jgi:hypothetical protein
MYGIVLAKSLGHPLSQKVIVGVNVRLDEMLGLIPELGF